MKIFIPTPIGGYFFDNKYTCFSLIKKLLSMMLLLIFSGNILGQIGLPTTATVTQNFDGMGNTSGAVVPANWKVFNGSTPTYSGGVNTISQQASSGSPSTGSFYNWGTLPSDRALGVMTSSGFSSPNSIMAYFRNTNTINLTNLTVSYDLERYRINSATASVQFYYSLDGSTWIPASGGDIATTLLPPCTATPAANASKYDFNPTGTPTGGSSNASTYNNGKISVTPFTFLINGTTGIAPNTDVYLRWSLNTTGTNSQGIGIDNVSVVAGFAAAQINLSDVALPTTPNAFDYIVGFGPSSPSQSFTVSGANLSIGPGNITVAPASPFSYEVSLNNSTFSSSINIGYGSGANTLTATTVYIRLKAGLAIGPYNETINVTGGGAPARTIACTGTVKNFYNSNTDVVAVTSSEPAFVSSTQNTAPPLTSTTGTQVWSFTIRDGGASASDADGLPTIIKSIALSQTIAVGYVGDLTQAIKTISLFDGTTLIATGVVSTSQVSFTGLTYTVPNNTSKTLTVRLSLNCGIGLSNKDGDAFLLSIANTSITTDASTVSSQKSSFATAASAIGKNLIDVAATKLIYTQQPGSTVAVNANFSPAVIVIAQDNCGNTDKDFTGTITVNSSAGAGICTPQSTAAAAGIASFAGLSHNAIGGPYTLTATYGAMSVVSNSFTVTNSTTLGSGDLMFVGFDTYVNGSPDLISIANFVTLQPGTKFLLANMVYDYLAPANVRQDRWYNGNGTLTQSPPFIEFTYTGAGIAKGSVICISLDGNGLVTAITVNGVDKLSEFNAVNSTGINCKLPDIGTNWTYVNFSSNNPDAIFLLQGTFSADLIDGSGNLYKTFAGSVFGGIQNRGTFQLFSVAGNNGGSRVSRIHPQMECVGISSGAVAGSNGNYAYYNSASNHNDTHRNLVKAIAAYSGTNWTKGTSTGVAATDGDDLAGNNTCSNSFTVTSNVSPGQWRGDNSTDWFDCANWDDFTVPLSTTDVLISSSATNDATLDYNSANAIKFNYAGDAKSINIIGRKLNIKYTGVARANTLNLTGNLTINTAGGLNMNDGVAGTTDGTINIAGNWVNYFPNGFDAGESLVNFNSTSNTQTITAPEGESFYNFTNSNTTAGGLVLANNNANVTINNFELLSTGTSLTINKNTLTLKGQSIGLGTITGSNTSNIVVSGSTPGSFGGLIFTVGAGFLDNFTINRTGAGANVYLSNNLSINTLATINAGIFNAAGYSFSGPGGLVMTGGELQLGRGGVGITLPELTGSYNLTNGIINFNSVFVQNIKAINYYNLTSTSTGARVFANAGTVGIANVFTPGTNAYSFTGSTIDYNGAVVQNIVPFVASAAGPGSTYNNLTLSNGTTTKLLTANTDVEGDLTLKNDITFSLGNNFLNLKSTSGQTARVAPISSTASISYGVSGKFVIERYYPAKRAWRLITAPITGDASKTVFNSWQVGGASPAGSGTYVSGPSETAANGLDVTPQHNYSLKTFNQTNSQFVGVPNTKTNLISGTVGGAGSPDNMGYFMFVRGDRTVANVNAFNAGQAVNFTTLRDTGKIQTQSYTFACNTNTGTNNFTLIGNPYASPIDFASLGLSGVVNRFRAWDPYLNGVSGVGGYVIVDLTSGVNITVPFGGGSTTQTQIIQSSQAFIVETNSATTPSVTFNESSKSSLNNLGLFRPVRQPLQNLSLLATNLYAVNTDGSASLADGTLVQFHNTFSNGIDYLDALKFGNVNETFGISSSNSFLMLQRRKPLTESDTIYFKLIRANKAIYRFKFLAQHLPQNNLAGFLEDVYKHTSTPINMDGDTWIDIPMDNDAGSRAADRFRLVFKKSSTYTNLMATVKGENVLVNWDVSGEININHYEIERSADGVNFFDMMHLNATGNNSELAAYMWNDEKPAPGAYYYRIKSISNNGVIGYSEMVKVLIAKSSPSLYVFPNPVTDNFIQLQLNDRPAGTYRIRLLNSLGQVISTQRLFHTGGTSSLSINTDNNIAVGPYLLEVVDPGKKITTLKVLISSKK